MTSLALVTFDIEDGSGDDYEAISEGLAAIGLIRTVTGDSGKPRNLPHNTYAGEYKKVESASEFRDQLADLVTEVIKKQGKVGKVFVVVSQGTWAWGWRPVKK